MSTSLGILLRPITLVPGDVGDVALAEERQQVVLAQAVEVDVLDDHHLAVIDGEQGVVEDLVDVHVVAARQELERLFDALRRIQQSLTARIFSELGQELPDERLHYGNCTGFGLWALGSRLCPQSLEPGAESPEPRVQSPASRAERQNRTPAEKRKMRGEVKPNAVCACPNVDSFSQ